MAKFEVRFSGDICKGCELCRIFCPKKIIVMSSRINEKGYSPAELSNPEECTGCKSCALVCPDGVIEIFKEDKAQ